MKTMLIIALGVIAALGETAEAQTTPAAPICELNQAQVSMAGCTEIIVKGVAAPDALARAYYMRGVLWFSSRNFARSEADFTDAIRLKGDVAEYYTARAFARITQGDLDGALQDLDESLKLRPGDFQTLAMRGAALEQKGEYDRAIQDYDAALRLRPGNVQVLLNRAVAWRDKGDIGRALADGDEAIKTAPQTPDAYAARCLTRAVAAIELDKALADCDQAIAMNAKNAFFFSTRAFTHYRRGEFDAAVSDASRSLEIAPDNAAALADRGLSERALGRRADGDADIAAAERSDPKVRALFAKWKVRLDPQ